MKSNILYDFKRSFLRVSVLSFLALFLIAGTFFTYSFLHTIPLAEFNNVNVVVTVERTASEYHFLGLVFDNQGNPISNAKATVVCSNSTEIYYTNSSGYFSFYGKPIEIVLTHYGQQKSIKFSTNYSAASYSHYYINVSEFYNSYVPNSALIIGYNDNTAKIITFKPNTTLHFYKGTTFYFSPAINELLDNITIVQSMKINTIRIPAGTTFVYAIYKMPDGYQSIGAPFNSAPLIETEFLQFIGTFMSYYFSLAFSIISIYVAYQMFGKLKDRGLPLILARPIIRSELYFTRYFSGVTAIILASLIFSLATSIMFTAYTGVFPSYDMTMLFAFVFSNIIVWYSLSYLFFSKFS